MKKLFLFLLFPIFAFGQDVFIQQKWKEDVSNVKVGDTITLQLQWVDRMDDALNPDPTLVQIDWEYNTDLLQLLSHQFILADNPNANKSFNSWLNYNYTPNTNTPQNLTGEYVAGLTYPTTQGWGINRVTIQDSGEIIGKTNTGDKILIEAKYSVKDISTTSYTDYTNLVTLNWANVEDNRTGDRYNAYADPLSLDLTNVAGSPAGTVTFQLQTPNASNGADYKIVIEPLEQWLAMNSSTPPSTTEYIDGNFNTGGQFITTGLKQNVEYVFNVFIEPNFNQTTQTPTYPQWLDDVVTVSDVIQVFKQAIGTEPDGTGNVFQYNIQKQLANVNRQGPNDPVDFEDSYVLLAHIAGILDNAADTNNSTATDFYPITSFANGAINQSGFFDTFGQSVNSETEWLAQRKFTLTDTQAKTFNIAHGFMGDADLSHSTTPNLNSSTQIAALSLSRARRPQNIMKAVAQENLDLDVVSTLQNGKVVVKINLTKEDLAGMQFNISYDKSILTFEDIIFDTGNTMTNFAKHFNEGRINFGTINIDKENIKTGQPFKLTFTPKVSIQNTVGLVNFRVTDAVKHNGTKVNLNIQ